MTTPNNVPVVNAGLLYVNGGVVSVASTTTLAVTACQARDATNVTDIQVTTTSTTINAARNGLNGLDTGSLAANTWYYVYLIGSSNGLSPSGYLISTSGTAPTLPGQNYDSTRRIGWALTGGSSTFISNLVMGTGTVKTYQWLDEIATAVTAGSATTFTAVDLSTGVPPQACQVTLKCAYTPAVATNTFKIRPSGLGTSGLILKGSVAAVVQDLEVQTMAVLVSSLPKIDYLVTASDAIAINVYGFVDSL